MYVGCISERLRGVFTTRHYTNPRLPYQTLPYLEPFYYVITASNVVQSLLRARSNGAFLVPPVTHTGLSSNENPMGGADEMPIS